MPASSPPSRILVVDDHPIVREGIVRLVSQQKNLVCCGQAGTVAETQTAVERLKPDLVILDLRLRGADGLDLIKSLKSQFGELRILVLSQYEAPMYVERALRAGAQGYVVKEQGADELVQAIRTVLAGDVYLARGMASMLLHKLVGPAAQMSSGGVASLTDRELHVLELLGTGMSSREIATELHLSFKTVETHRENIKRKLNLRGASALIHYATQWSRQHVALPPEDITSTPPGSSPSAQ